MWHRMKSVRLTVAILLCIIILFGISCGDHGSGHKTPTPTQYPTSVSTITPVVSPTIEPTSTATPAPTSGPTPTLTPVATSTVITTPTPEPSSTPVATASAVPTSAPTITPSSTSASSPTLTPTKTPNPTSTPITGTNTVYCENVSTKTHGTSFTLKVMAFNITPNVDTGQFDLKYDPSILSVASVADGNIGGTAVPMSDGWNVITPGILRVVIAQSTAASGSGYLCNITFNAIAAGTSTLNFVGDAYHLFLNDNTWPPKVLGVTWKNGSVIVQ